MKLNLTPLIALTSVMSLSFSLLVQAEGKSKGLESVVVDDLNAEQRPWINNINAPRSQELQVTAWLDRQDSVYYIGEEVVFYVKTNQDAYLTLIDVGTSGRESIVIFPNKYRQNNRIKANQVLRIPAVADSAEMFQLGGPPGRELIKVIVTTHPLNFFNQTGLTTALGPYQKLNRASDAVSKDLNVVLRQPNNAKRYNDTQLIIEVRPHSFNDKLLLFTDKAEYYPGEKLKLRVTPAVDCYLTLLNIGTTGDRTVIFPNRYQPNNFIPQGHTILIPGDNPNFHYLIKGISGLEKIIGTCRANRRPIYMAQYNFKAHTFQSIGKDLNIVERRKAAKPVARAETVFWVKR